MSEPLKNIGGCVCIAAIVFTAIYLLYIVLWLVKNSKDAGMSAGSIIGGFITNQPENPLPLGGGMNGVRYK